MKRNLSLANRCGLLAWVDKRLLIRARCLASSGSATSRLCNKPTYLLTACLLIFLTTVRFIFAFFAGSASRLLLLHALKTRLVKLDTPEALGLLL